MADRRIALQLWLLLSVFLAIFHRGHFMSTDEVGVYFQTKALSERGSLAVPERVHMAFRGRGGASYSQYAVGQSLLAVPFHAAGRSIERRLSEEAWRYVVGPLGRQSWTGEPPILAGAFFVLFYPPVAAGALAALFFLFERRLGASRGAALAASLALATCTHAGLLSTLFLQHTTETIGALGAFYFWHRFRSTGAARDVLFGSVLAAAIFNVRAAGALDGLALGGYLLFVLAERFRARRDLRALASFGLAALAPVAASAALYLLVNKWKWGTWIESPQLAERSTLGGDPRKALAGFLVSPGMSVFVYTPLLLLLPATLPKLWRRHRAEACTIVALFVSTLAFYSTYELWTGLYSCPGPRYLFTAMVFLMLPLGPWLDEARGLASRAAFAALAAAGALVQLLSAIPSWGRIVQGYQGWWPPFGFVFEPAFAPLVVALQHALDPAYADLWVLRTALGWRGQPGAPATALAIGLGWLALTALLAFWLRRSLAAAEAQAG